MRIRTRLFAATLLVTATLSPVSPVGAATAGNGAAATPTASATPSTGKDRIVWTPCEEEPAAECGKLTVPIDWSRPDGPTVDLAVARRKATDPAARIGSLVLGPGGPGGSGVDFAFNSREFFTEDIAKRFDIVGFDPRGVARSNPVICSTSVYNQMPYAIMKSQADYDKWVAYTERLRADCRARTGPLYDHVGSADVARDMEALRAALGEEKLTFYGVSYGTLPGQMYAELFPDRVRAMVLDGNMDHSLDVKGFLDTEAEGVQDAFDQFVGWCEQETSCAVHGKDVRAIWKDILAKANSGKLYYPGTDRLMSEVQVLWLGVVNLEGPDWQSLSEIINALDGGEVPEDLPPMPGRQPVGGEVAELPTAILCQDYNLPVRDYEDYARLLASARRLAPDMRYNAMPMEDLPVCLNHPTPNPQHRLRYTGDAPILLGTTLHDPSTPYSWNVNVHKQLGPKAYMITYEGWGHRIYGKEDCNTKPMDDYLISLTVPPHGYRCPVARGSEPADKSEIQKRRHEPWQTDSRSRSVRS